MTVYLLWVNNIIDKYLVGVFSTKEKAEDMGVKVQKQCNSDEFTSIEEWEIK